MKMYDTFLLSTIPITMSNNTLLVNDQPVRGGAGSFASSLSTYQIFTSTLQIASDNLYNYTAQFNLDVVGTARITDYISVGTIYAGAQYIGLQYG